MRVKGRGREMGKIASAGRKVKESGSVRKGRLKGKTKGGLKEKGIARLSLDDGLVGEVARDLGSGIPLRMICATLGVGRGTFDGWMDKGEVDLENGVDSVYSRLYVSVARAQKVVVGECVRGILESAKADPRNWQGYAWLLERAFPEEFGIAKRAEIGSKGGDVRVVVEGKAERPGKVIGVVEVKDA